MRFTTYNNKRKWQRAYIKSIFEKSSDKKKLFSKIVLQNIDLINKKNEHIPKYLFKYYAPTSDNILDIKNQRIWLSHPSSFNDPFDCVIGYDDEKYEKNCLLKFIKENGCVKEKKKSNGFTEEEKNRIIRSRLGDVFYWNSKIESYFDAKRKILDSKSNSFQRIVSETLTQQAQQIDYRIDKLKNINIRVACFSELDKYDTFHKQVVMWSHYADNHKGFCIEYDLESLKNDIQLSPEYFNFYGDHKDEYLKERNEAIIKAGLFPIEYTANRINIPVTKLNQIGIDTSGNIKYNSNIDELIYKTFVVKSGNWSYEKEWRIIVDEQISNYYNNKIPFPYAKTIHLGCRASKELIDTMYKIGEEIGAEVNILKMDGKKFILESTGVWKYKYEMEKKQWNDPYRFK